jgi:hypothetical protein
MHDELLTGTPKLIRVVLAGEEERSAHTLAVDLHERLIGVLLDDGEEVPEELALARGQLIGTERGQRRGAPYAACRMLALRDVSPSNLRRSYSR